jgi:aldehyde dehydrogenase (NAD+)
MFYKNSYIICMQHIDNTFRAQQKNRTSLALTSHKKRETKIRNLLNNFLEMEHEVLNALSKDLGKSKTEVYLAEILGVKTEALFAIKNLKKWMKKKRVPTPAAISFTKSWVKPEPKGSVLIISPWNYPIMLCLNPLIAAIAAGNTAIIKPSELTPESGKVVQELIKKTFNENEVSVILGEKSVAEKLLSLPFNHILFTGSPEIGKIVMRAAAKHLSGVTLELGGKSPTIIDSTANIKEAAWKIAFFKYANAGQTCTAPDYILCEESVHEKLVEELDKNITNFFGGNLVGGSKDYCAIANEFHFARLDKLLEESKKGGAIIACGGHKNKKSLYLSPTVLTGVQPDNPIMKEEIFGPLLPIVKVKSVDEAISYINEKPKPLALYLFSKNKTNCNLVLNSTSSGGLVINDCVLHHTNPNLPFGGINNSGVGSYHGKFGFDAFSHQKAVMQSSGYSPFKLMLPPYTETKARLASLIKKFF